MIIVPQSQDPLPPDLRKQLALAVQSIQWSYAIFWSMSTTQSGVLEWGDGYYNGEIRTRRTNQEVEMNADQLGLQRSQQLRELYDFLVAGEANQVDKRASSALSPEDLTEIEWFFLVCMSFIFNIGQGLPGTALANSQPIWLCNAHIANSKVFSRSLLAKSASIQTVVCFPFLRGVVELGVTDLVSEDPSLIHNIKTILENPHSTISNKSCFPVLQNLHIDNDLTCISELDLGIVLSPVAEFEEFQMGSPDLNIDKNLRKCGNPNSMEPSDCTSQIFADAENIISLRNPKILDCNHIKLDHQSNEIHHYQSVLGTLLKGSHPLILGPHFRHCDKAASSFVSWKKEKLSDFVSIKSSQNILKKALFEIARMHDKDNNGKNEPETGINQRGEMNEKFDILKSLVPSFYKVDEVSILNGTIDYLKVLKERVTELEERMRSKPLLNKRKAFECDEFELVSDKDGVLDDAMVSVIEKDVVIEIKCPWRECLLLDIMNSLSNLHLDTHFVQSSTIDGLFSISIKSKFKGSDVIAAVKLKRLLQSVVRRC